MAAISRLTARRFAAIVLAASLGVLGVAMASQYWGGLSPCELCLLQRWPWRVAIIVSAIALAAGERHPMSLIAVLLGLVFLAGAGLAFYHVGVEQHWFAGPTACTAGGADAGNVDALRAQLIGKQPVLCDQVQWSLVGISLAGWNLLASLGMAAFCIAAARHRRLQQVAV
ncbi:MAG: disulfide bond formation protein B [Alphaproteobacteria bacterium]|nr:disulfide bond formation protein B [Alphaproteobacteria bacterium]